MTLASLPFLYFFLPVSVLITFLLPEKARLYVLAGISLVFYAWGSPSDTLLLLVLSLFNYTAGRILDELLWNGRSSAGRFVLILSVILNLGTLCIFKYSSLDFPIGISFYTFSALSCLFDVYLDRQEVERNPVYLILYISFFPKVISGPIVSYAQWKDMLNAHSMNRKDILNGIPLFLVGLFKKILIADRLGLAFSGLQGASSMAAGTAWLGMLLYSFQLYYDFSGYSDMAIGAARMFGFKFDQNFNYPYTSTSISDFWRRWHISLGAWFRDYVYIPMGGNRCRTARQVLNLMTVWALTGIWHGSTLNFLVWGLWHGCFILLDKFVIGRRMEERVPVPVRILLTDFVAMLGWVWFFSSGVRPALQWFGWMFGIGAEGAGNAQTLFVLRQNLLLLIAAAVGSTPVVHQIHRHYAYHTGKAEFAVSVALNIALLVLATAGMIGSTYSTFLYAKF